MDYEWKIKLIEEEARHEKAMSDLRSERFSALDRSIEATGELQHQTALNIAHLIATQEITQRMLQDLITLLTKGNIHDNH